MTLSSNLLTQCPACGSNQIIPHFKDKEARADRCRNCDLVFSNPQKFQPDISDIYQEDYYKSAHAALGYEDYVGNNQDIKHTFKRRIKTLLKYKQSGSLLDAGCACGYFLEVAAQAGFSPEGIDCSQWATDFARENFNFPVHTGLFGQNDFFRDKKFDVIACWDIVEQLPEPKFFFKNVLTHLKEDGLVILTIRDINSFMARLLKDRWIHFRPQEKYVYFSQKSICHLLNSCGFEVIDISPKHGGKDCTVDILINKISHANKWIGKILEGLSRVLKFRHKQLYVNFGDSLIVVAKKR